MLRSQPIRRPHAINLYAAAAPNTGLRPETHTPIFGIGPRMDSFSDSDHHSGSHRHSHKSSSDGGSGSHRHYQASSSGRRRSDDDSPQPLPPPQVIVDRKEEQALISLADGSLSIQRKLGKGGFGQVDLGIYLETGQEVAVKRGKTVEELQKKHRHIPLRTWRDLSLDDQLIKEIFLLGHVLRPTTTNSIVELQDIFLNERNELHAVLPRAHGDLFRWMTDHSRSPSASKGAAIKTFLTDICRGLAHLHSFGIIHRDIKPENVLVYYDKQLQEEHALLADFGLSMPSIAATRTVGTIEYIAPEAWAHKTFTPGMDVWALGLMIHNIFDKRDPEYMTDLDMCQKLMDDLHDSKPPRFDDSALKKRWVLEHQPNCPRHGFGELFKSHHHHHHRKQASRHNKHNKHKKYKKHSSSASPSDSDESSADEQRDKIPRQVNPKDLLKRLEKRIDCALQCRLWRMDLQTFGQRAGVLQVPQEHQPALWALYDWCLRSADNRAPAINLLSMLENSGPIRSGMSHSASGVPGVILSCTNLLGHNTGVGTISSTRTSARHFEAVRAFALLLHNAKATKPKSAVLLMDTTLQLYTCARLHLRMDLDNRLLQAAVIELASAMYADQFGLPSWIRPIHHTLLDDARVVLRKTSGNDDREGPRYRKIYKSRDSTRTQMILYQQVLLEHLFSKTNLNSYPHVHHPDIAAYIASISSSPTAAARSYHPSCSSSPRASLRRRTSSASSASASSQKSSSGIVLGRGATTHRRSS